MSDDTQSKRLPATWEEYQRARREAFLDGSHWREGQLYIAGNSASFEAAHRYPIVRKVPRVVEVNRNLARFFARVSKDHEGVSFFRDRECTERFSVTGLFPHEPAIYADLAANPYEEIAE